MFVNATDSGDRIASELDVGDIEDAFWSEAISFADEFCKRFGPITHRFRADLNWIDCIAKDASKNRHQTGAFLRQLCADWMELPKVWRHPFETSKILRNASDTSLFLRVRGR